ncbi:LETM1-like protein, partial [Prunus dulcis]
ISRGRLREPTICYVITPFSTYADNSILSRHSCFLCTQTTQTAHTPSLKPKPSPKKFFAFRSIFPVLFSPTKQIFRPVLSPSLYMATKLCHNGFLSPSSSNPWHSRTPARKYYSGNKVVDLDHLLSNWGYSRKRCFIRLALLEHNNGYSLNLRAVGHRKCYLNFRKARRMGNLVPLASADDGVTVNGSPQASTSRDVEAIKVKLNQSLNGEDSSDGLVQFLHEAARVFELAIKEQGSFSKLSWFSTAWLSVDKNAWVKALCYQASVYSLLQAASEIASRGDGRDRDINVFVQRSLLRQSASLESLIQDQLSAKQPEAYEWFFSEQVPLVVTSFVNYFEGDSRFTAATIASRKGTLLGSSNTSDISLLMLALTCNAAITKLGQAKVSCPQFFSTIADITGRLMDMLVDFIPIRQAYLSVKDIGLRREFLVHFGPRAATCRVKNDRGSEEVVFWVDLVQMQLQRAIDRERIWSRLTTSESIEVPDWGQHLILSSAFINKFLSIVVCEELDWLSFYPGNSGTPKQSHGHKSKWEGPPNAEAIPQVLESFIKYSKWLESPSNVKAARFLSRGHNKLVECMEERGLLKNEKMKSYSDNTVERTRSGTRPPTEKELDSFDRALESVEEAVIRLEKLLQDLHVSSSNSGKEHIKAACSDLEKIRKLKKEAEFLEASFRTKAASLKEEGNRSRSSINKQQQFLIGKNRKNGNKMIDGGNRASSNSRGLWSSFMRPPTRKSNPELIVEEPDNEFVEQTASNIDFEDPESTKIQRFELLRNELIELEKRVQRSADKSENEDIKPADDSSTYEDDIGATQLVQVQKKENIIEKSFDKLKEASTDVWQGTQLLAIDTAAATGLLRRVLIGDELTEKEKKILRRTLTDLASVFPIGVLMLLPVTAVGHAAMLAAIQRYVPALIPSTYGPERLDLLRQVEKLKEMESSEDSTPGRHQWLQSCGASAGVPGSRYFEG